ncbi:unnamed protein product [Mytilus edulis]|uniref:Uncharacterized protein n=1 Tax=Mytilus edulis TaxID=6550 RepID=A0A8S3QWI5_MYTED|nr:unnamed protein product [Mytilus edulis]
MTEDDIRDNAVNRYETFGIVISDDEYVFQQYIERWFECLTEADSVKECINANRSVLDVSFRTALRTYIKQQDKEEIQSLIQTGSSDFLNTMFVLTDNEKVIDNEDNQFECFGIFIPVDLLEEYITRWIDCMTKADSMMEFVRANRSSMNILLQSYLEAYI